MADEEFAGLDRVESYRLVGSRNDNQIRRVRAQMAKTYVEADSFHAEALAKHGLPPDFWLPFELAIKWRTNDYPAYPTRESYQHWDELQKEVLGFQFLAEDFRHMAEETLADWEHDRELIAKYAPTLASAHNAVAIPPVENAEATATPKSVAELLEWCHQQLLWLEDHVHRSDLSLEVLESACQRLGQSAFRYAETFGPPELPKKLHLPSPVPPFLTCDQSGYNLKTLAAWCESELRHSESRGLLDAPQPRSPAEFKHWCDECLGILRNQSSDEASYFAREAIALAAVFCAGLVLRELQQICVTIYPMPSRRAIQILEACALVCGRSDEGAHASTKLSGDEPENASQWLSVSQAAQITGANPGVISRAADSGKLKSNGKKGAERRVDAVALAYWQLQRANRPEPVESDDDVRRKLREAGKD
jgi:hypothetical protein